MRAATMPAPVLVCETDDNETWLLLRLGDRFVGYLDVIDCGDELWVMEVGVHPDHRGHGHGTRLLKALLDGNPGSQIALSCGSFAPGHVWRRAPEGLTDPVLAAWYARHGFRLEPDDEDGRRMVRLP
ncbi:GNAT family N-acetyltransferase [Streptomyces halobius]|uniref:GNAT family N-acetyltransferase n=1 Tax=Streptomyces halobius TaxID=2879846 RepID=A0ABY4MG91_9ACTN|nr:GNAT family N-acetyltransferase [Streptomyces halobius]UQA96717.1 GNAT family N-acetyltransferase [Streptomyces halobius]